MSDAVRLTLPKDEMWSGVARLVLGGLATRLSFSYEALEDLQLGLDTVLGTDAYIEGDEVTIELRVLDDGVQVRTGPVGEALRADLERDVDESEGVGLGRLLQTVAEAVEIDRVDGREWLRLEKRLPGASVTSA